MKLGTKHSEEAKKKMSLAHMGGNSYWKGKKLSEETKAKLSESHKGKRFKHSEETKEKLRGENNSWYGKHHTQDAKDKMSKTRKGGKLSAEHKINIGKSIKGKKFKAMSEIGKINISKALKGRKLSDKHKQNISEATKGEANNLWRGGISFEPYGLEFNNDLKEVIRNRDRRKCKICEKTELDNKQKLTIHHIDYDKKNCNPNNLISLCRKCHLKTNHNREYWIEYFSNNF